MKRTLGKTLAATVLALTGVLAAQGGAVAKPCDCGETSGSGYTGNWCGGTWTQVMHCMGH